MKKIILIGIGFLFFSMNLIANYYSYLPYTITQPNGEEIKCFVSGDEFFNWLHDNDGFTIIQAPNGYFYYGVESNGLVIPGKNKVNSVNPEEAGLKKWAKISSVEYQKSKAFTSDELPQQISNAPHDGTLNNIVVYIRFSDDTEFTTSRQTFDDLFNQTSGISLKSYYSDVSYDQLTVNSTHYPDCALSTNYSYQDSHPRAYFEPYNETTNPIGYTGGNNGSERTFREHTLLRDAIDWINTNSPVSGALNLDGDSDGRVDNVCFNVRGGYGAWASLLWAHSWSLYSYTVMINSKQVSKYTFQPEPQVNVQTLRHEMFHAIGAPDLYHYTSNGIKPVYNWDLMESGFGHMGAYMKWKYSNQTWISSIPEITTSGTYSLKPLASPTNNCYKIASPNSTSQYFILEYRRKVTNTYENNVPGSGLLVYRIDPTSPGNANGPPDEVYIFRPDGTTSVNGSPSLANYSSESGRTAINSATNPFSFLQDGSAGGLNISNIGSADTTITFTVNISNVENLDNFMATAISATEIDLQWDKNTNGDSTLLLCNSSLSFGVPANGTQYSLGDTISGGGTVIYKGIDTTFAHTGLQNSTTYYYKLVSYDVVNNYSSGVYQDASTPCPQVTIFPWNEGFENGGNMPDCWTQQQVNQSGLYWIFTNGGVSGHPAGAHGGSYNTRLNDNTYPDNITQLITPSIDISRLSNPVLTFWHTQTTDFGLQDKLTVYYKTSIRGTWTQLASYAFNTSVWTQETIFLPNKSSDYYINFEGNAKWGFGVCLDDLQIKDSINVPTILSLTSDTVASGANACYDATDTIYVGDSVLFSNGSIVDIISGAVIRFLPGFQAENGSEVHAYITTTASFCDAIPAPIVIAEPVQETVMSLIHKKTEKNIKVYPNPNNGRFTISLLNFHSNAEIVIYSSTGLVIQRTVTNTDNAMDLSTVQHGIYFVRVTDGKDQYVQKIIIQ